MLPRKWYPHADISNKEISKSVCLIQIIFFKCLRWVAKETQPNLRNHFKDSPLNNNIN